MQRPEKLKDVGNARLVGLRYVSPVEVYAEFDRPVVPGGAANDCQLYNENGMCWQKESLSFIQATPMSLRLVVTGQYISANTLFLFIPEGTHTLRPLKGGRMLAGLAVIMLS